MSRNERLVKCPHCSHIFNVSLPQRRVQERLDELMLILSDDKEYRSGQLFKIYSNGRAGYSYKNFKRDLERLRDKGLITLDVKNTYNGRTSIIQKVKE